MTPHFIGRIGVPNRGEKPCPRCAGNGSHLGTRTKAITRFGKRVDVTEAAWVTCDFCRGTGVVADNSQRDR